MTRGPSHGRTRAQVKETPVGKAPHAHALRWSVGWDASGDGATKRTTSPHPPIPPTLSLYVEGATKRNTVPHLPTHSSTPPTSRLTPQ